ncbi:hypothetical protein GQ44DRAFT_704937 [Phaeosphaeriaceae sp. PMI808]|nr:hypothetical protein GQ44DRAFT_704937 [Phaeosphaeriaceae sp. PMI808]
MAEKRAAQIEKEDPMGEQATLYDVWQQADGLHKGEASRKGISFKNGFIRVRKSDWVTIIEEGWASETERTFEVSPWHVCEVLGTPEIKFTKA